MLSPIPFEKDPFPDKKSVSSFAKLATVILKVFLYCFSNAIYLFEKFSAQRNLQLLILQSYKCLEKSLIFLGFSKMRQKGK